jgi:TonB family protein
MRPRDVTLTIALSLSLALHALLCVGAAERYVHSARIWLPGFPRDELAASLYIEEPVALTDDPKLRLGEPDASGTAIDASPGDEALLAPQGFQDQPFLSRDPIGPGNVGEEPTDSQAIPGDGSAAQPSPPVPQSDPVMGLPAEQIAMQPYEPPKEKIDAPKQEEDGLGAIQPAPPPQEASPAGPTAPPSPPQVASVGANPGPLTAADPAPRGESEIDPVSMVGTLNLRRGSTEARSGRKHRVTRPQLNLAAKADLFSLRAGSLVLGLRIDSEGNVSHVKVLKTSGSEALDQTCKVAAYNWWFEPLTDKTGRRIADEFPFVIVF